MPWHVVTDLPGGDVACADYREQIARPMHQVNAELASGQAPGPALYEEIARWLGTHREQSAAALAAVPPAAHRWGHD
jgi:hypothetical protein